MPFFKSVQPAANPPNDQSVPILSIPTELLLHILNFVDPLSNRIKQRYPETSKLFFQVSQSKKRYDEGICKKLIISLIGERYIKRIENSMFSYKHIYHFLTDFKEKLDITPFIEFIDNYVNLNDEDQNSFLEYQHDQGNKTAEQVLLKIEDNKISKEVLELRKFGLSRASCNQFLARLIAECYIDKEKNPNGFYVEAFLNIYCKYGYIEGLSYFLKNVENVTTDTYNVLLAVENRQDSTLKVILEHIKNSDTQNENTAATIIANYFSISGGHVTQKAFSIIINIFPEVAELLMNNEDMLRGEMNRADYEEVDDCLKVMTPLLNYQRQLIEKLKNENAMLRQAQEHYIEYEERPLKIRG